MQGYRRQVEGDKFFCGGRKPAENMEKPVVAHVRTNEQLYSQMAGLGMEPRTTVGRSEHLTHKPSVPSSILQGIFNLSFWKG